VHVLVLDTATPAITAAVIRLDPNAPSRPDVAAERSTVDARAHGELLAPAIASVLAEARIDARRLDAIVAGVGPGPFTGLRVGLVTAVTMGQALAIPTYGVCSLDAIGVAAKAPTLVATDARRQEIYWALYQDAVALTPPAVDRPAHVAERLAEHAVEVALGDGARRYASVLPVPVLDEPRYPSAVALAQLAADRVLRPAPSEALTPLYLRRPDAAEPHPPKSVNG
jgi:tRNA threonylcarbamoyl adenosine modification protein YeaZ